jgi:hypothetical protein
MPVDDAMFGEVQGNLNLAIAGTGPENRTP